MTTPEGLEPSIRTREIVFEADVEGVTPVLKLATVHRGGTGHMTFASDEGPGLGGLCPAPTPLMYLSAARDDARDGALSGERLGAVRHDRGRDARGGDPARTRVPRSIRSGGQGGPQR